MVSRPSRLALLLSAGLLQQAVADMFPSPFPDPPYPFVIGEVPGLAGEARIDSLLLSCRALGRDLEQVFLGRSLELLRDRWGVPSVRGEVRRSTRNEQVADFYARCGFSADATDAAGGEFHVGSISAIIDACRRTHVANRDEANGQ